MRYLRWTALVLVVVVPIAVGVGGWHYSDLLREDGLRVRPEEPPEYDVEVLAVEGTTVTLSRTPDSERSEVWGLEWDGGYGQLGDVLSVRPDSVVRSYRPFRGRLSVGETARLDADAFPDPRAAGLSYRSITFETELGDFPAWSIDGSGRTWAIFVHGRAAPRTEAVRVLPVFAGLDMPSLVITYRNDPEAAEAPDGFYRFGQSEWRDLEAAVRHAVRQGAEEVVLVGYSMGGGIVMSFLYHSSLAPRVRAVVLDSPVLDFGETVEFEAAKRGIPSLLTSLAKSISSLRFGVRWSALDYVGPAHRLEAPILLIHGTDDRTVPVATSDALAASRPDLVDYLRVPGAGHTRAWNADPARYEEAVGDFLEEMVLPAEPEQELETAA